MRVVRDPKAGADALRRLASEVSGQIDLETLFADVVADAMDLFALARIGLWLYHADAPPPVHAWPPSTGSRTRSSTGCRRSRADATAAGLTRDPDRARS